MTEAKKYNYVIYLGRFQPFHDGHLNVCMEALSISEHLIVLVGGDEKARQAKNPWTFMERLAMISRTLNVDNVFIGGIHDHPYSDDGWADEVRLRVSEAIGDNEPGKIALVGHHKDDSSYYLNLFPDWDYVEVGNYQNIDATAIRDIYFSHPYINILATGIPPGTRDVMKQFASTPEYTGLAAEHAYIKKYKQSWASSPFPPILNTVDIAVVQDNKLLIIQRGGMPGNGLLALPGGYIDAGELLVKSAMRELQEETGVDFDLSLFNRLCITQKVFDHPSRSQLGRCITTLYVIDADYLAIDAKAGDDAAAVCWLPFENLDAIRAQCSGDHWYMMKYAVEQYSARKKFQLKVVKQ
ncbi:MAG: adenylyltransferase/cytidyltransferase family protein [Candidatus Cloacimonetes bacterium]|nr:adenylyltransferase/cytidyltransferase family protein [Candidatus Cloacimonadota bacterium]